VSLPRVLLLTTYYFPVMGGVETHARGLAAHLHRAGFSVRVVTKRIDTGSPWILANNPAAPYWEDGRGHDGNKYYKLATLVRASTAAPSFFDPEILPISGRKERLADSVATPLDKPLVARFLQSVLERIGWRAKAVPDPRDYGLFIDGGVTPHNNPSFALLQMISLTPFKLCWTPGPENLSVTRSAPAPTARASNMRTSASHAMRNSPCTRSCR